MRTNCGNWYRRNCYKLFFDFFNRLFLESRKAFFLFRISSSHLRAKISLALRRQKCPLSRVISINIGVIFENVVSLHTTYINIKLSINWCVTKNYCSEKFKELYAETKKTNCSRQTLYQKEILYPFVNQDSNSFKNFVWPKTKFCISDPQLSLFVGKDFCDLVSYRCYNLTSIKQPPVSRLICPELNTNEMLDLYDSHDEVPLWENVHQNTYT